MDPERAVKRIMAQSWGCSEERVLTEDFSECYPWASRHRIVAAAGPDALDAFVAVDPQGVAIVFLHDAAKLDTNVRTLNRLLAAEAAGFPGVLAPPYLAKTLRDFLLGTQGFVGSLALWEEQSPTLDSWVEAQPLKQTAALFEKYCEEPALVRQRDGWTLRFFFFNPAGGVEQWTVSGDATQIREAAFQMAVPEHTFYFPYL
jgi:hypothetical protein